MAPECRWLAAACSSHRSACGKSRPTCTQGIKVATPPPMHRIFCVRFPRLIIRHGSHLGRRGLPPARNVHPLRLPVLLRLRGLSNQLTINGKPVTHVIRNG